MDVELLKENSNNREMFIEAVNEAGKYLIEYDYNVYDYIVDGENIYLEYCLDSDSFMGINYYLLFEYDYEKEELTFISAVGTMIIDNIYKI